MLVSQSRGIAIPLPIRSGACHIDTGGSPVAEWSDSGLTLGVDEVIGSHLLYSPGLPFHHPPDVPFL